MTALAEKLKEAGADTVGARLTAACVEALRRCPDGGWSAWEIVGDLFGHEFLRGLRADMQGGHILEAPRNAAALNTYTANVQGRRDGVNMYRQNVAAIEPKPYQPRVMDQARVELRAKQQEIVRSKFKNSAGIAWSEVSWHELTALARDGNEAAALLGAAQAQVPNDGRTVGQVLGVAKVDEIIGGLRRQ